MAAAGGQLPRRAIAAYDNYADAQRAVDRLADAAFPVERVAIVGHGLRYAEQVVGRMTIARAAAIGASQGAALGAILGLLAGLIFSTDPNPSLILMVLYGMGSGALIGAAFGALTHAASGGMRDFVSIPSMQAERYELLVDDEVADQAAQILRAVDRVPAA
jgi:hypothetical protein